MDNGFWLGLLSSTVILTAPLLLAAMGGYASERSGIINIALEGKMLAAACACVIASIETGSAAAGLAAALLAATALSLLHLVATQVYGVDAVVSGMAVNALALGGTNFLAERVMSSTRSAGFASAPIAAYEWCAFLIPALLWAASRWTRAGLRLRAVGSDPDKARLAGIQPQRVRLGALLITGCLTGLAGAMIATNAGGFTNNMTAGRGYIALAALILGGWRPAQTMLACMLLGFCQALQLSIQGTHFFGVAVPVEVWSCLPYVVTVVALAGFLGRNRAPSGLAKL